MLVFEGGGMNLLREKGEKGKILDYILYVHLRAAVGGGLSKVRFASMGRHIISPHHPTALSKSSQRPFATRHTLSPPPSHDTDDIPFPVPYPIRSPTFTTTARGLESEPLLGHGCTWIGGWSGLCRCPAGTCGHTSLSRAWLAYPDEKAVLQREINNDAAPILTI